MYSTCLFCHTDLGRNEAVEHFPVGQRLAFDAKKGRLWVVCRRCGRWNLTPIEERWEAIEECERAFRDTRLRVSTEQIGLAKPHGVELIRIGAPLRPEFAAWRYGSEFGARRRRLLIAGGTGGMLAAAAGVAAVTAFAPALAVGAAAALYIPGVTTIPSALAVSGIVALREYIRSERVVARLPGPEGQPLTVRAYHLDHVRIGPGSGDGAVTLDVAHDGGHTPLEGHDAERAGGVLLARSTLAGASPSLVRAALARIEQAGDAATFLAGVARAAERRRGTPMLVHHTAAFRVSAVERLAVEMALHESVERRAFEGELERLLEDWKAAEEIAAIADEL